MEQDDADELRRKLEQARRLASMTSDLTTMQRLREFADELSARLKNYFASRRQREEIRARAQELWEQNGRPGGRDLEFWLRAEREIQDENQERQGIILPS
jgi:hypothetical protein